MLTLALSIPVWASEHTVTIHRNEGLYQDGVGVYYCVKDGIMMTFTDGLDNENYLVERHGELFEINSYNYLVKRVVFHCVDNSIYGDHESFYWGPTTISIFQNFYNQSDPGNYTVLADGYTGVWTGTTNHIQFQTDAHPVRFGSVDIVYEKLDGDIFDLVTNMNQIQEGKTYILVTQNDDRVMKIKMNDEATFPSIPIVGWMGPESTPKTKVKVDGNACLFKLEQLRDTTIDGYSRKAAWFNTLNGYIRPSTSSSNPTGVILSTRLSDYNRGYFYLGTASNFLLRFKGRAGYYIRYNPNSKTFVQNSSTSDANTRIWLYKLAEAYNIRTVCDPANGGTISLGEGTVDSKSQQGETVHFTVNPADGYRVNAVTVTNDDTGASITCDYDATTGDYTYIMPAANVTITATFALAGQPFVITTECLPNDDAGYISVYDGVNVYDNAIHAYEGSTVTFWVGTRTGWVINEVKVTNPLTGEDVPFTMIDDQTAGGLRYQLTMPANNVHIQAIFYPYDRLFLLGTANGGNWAPNGPEFNYCPNENVYYLKVYYKGVRDVPGQDDDTMGYFSLTTVVHDNDWNYIRPYRLVANPSSSPVPSTPIADGETKPLYRVSNGASTDNAFTIPAGVYIFKVPVDKSTITVEEVPLTLTLNETPNGMILDDDDGIIYVPYGTVVQASSGLQAEVQGINEDEDAQTFKMSTDDGSSWTDGNTVTITQPGVTDVTGQAYIGYIIVENTGKYAYTPLSHIEGEISPETPVVVCDTLVGTWAVVKDGVKQLWAKDLGNKSIDKTYIVTGEDGQIDYVKDILEYQKTDWDQSNWVVLDFTGVDSDPEEFIGVGINPLAVRGDYVDAVKHRIVLTNPIGLNDILDGVDYTRNYPGYMDDYREEATGYNYMYNHYMMPNFMPENLNAPYGNGFVAGNDVLQPFQGVKLYFMNPKSQEVAHVMGVWNGNDQFTVYERDNHNNAYNYSGMINVLWDYNRVSPDDFGVPELDSDVAYIFHMAIERITPSGNTLNGAKPGSPSTSFIGYPLDLPAYGAIPTSVVDVNADKNVVAVSYYNLMGQESKTPYQGINIVVTSYSDGTRIATKQMR